MTHHAFEATQHVGNVGTEDAAVGVHLVHHHVAEVAQEAPPARVVGKNALMEHVRVR